MKSSLDRAIDNQQCYGSSKTYCEDIHHHSLDEFGSWHDAKADDADDGDEITERRVGARDSICLVPRIASVLGFLAKHWSVLIHGH